MRELKWQELLSPWRQSLRQKYAFKEKDDNKVHGLNLLDELANDYHSILLSASFRRLQDKTQVFPLDSGDFVRTRLTHSLEVASMAKRLAYLAGQEVNKLQEVLLEPSIINAWADLLLCAGLVHDIGNPPFGHYGETTIRLWFANNLPHLLYKGQAVEALLNKEMKEDLLHFEGNAQALRVLTKLHFAEHGFGLDLPYSLLHILVKYPVSSLDIDAKSPDIAKHKLGYFWAEREIFQDMTLCLGTNRNTTIGKDRQLAVDADNQMTFCADLAAQTACRHPLTYLLEAADDITYSTADIEDAYKKNKFNFDVLCKELANFARQNKGAYTAEQQATYRTLIKELKNMCRKAERKHLPEAKLYALQQWLAWLQNLLATAVTTSFASNYEAIMQGRWRQSLVSTGSMAMILPALGYIAYKYVFHSRQILKLELAANSILGGLLDLFIPACLNFDTENELNPVEQRLMDIISDNYLQCYRMASKGLADNEKLYLRILLVTDYISGMTDGFAKNLLQQLRG